MNTFKKIFSILIITIFSFINIVGVSAVDYVDDISPYNYENSLIKESILAKKELGNINNGKKYIEKTDELIEKIKNKKETLEKLNKKISELIGKFYAAKKTANNKDILILLKYINIKVELSLYRLNKVEKKSQVSEIDKKIEEIKNSNLSESEIKKVNEKLVSIQLNILDNTNSLFEKLLKEYEDHSNYEEKGDMKFNFSLNHELIGKIKTELKLNNYSAKNSGFDAQFTSQIEALIEATPKGEKEIKLQLKSFIDFISKDGNMYLLLDKFNITDDKGIEDIKQQVEMLKELAEKNKYIKIEDKSTKQFLENIKNINPANILNDSKNILSKPLLKPYKKDGDKYLLVPTKYACGEFKKLQAIFDPFNGEKCSDFQYELLLKNMVKYGDLYIELGTKNKLGFNAYPQFDIEKFESYIVFTDTNIEEINSVLETNKEGEGFNLEYIKNNKLDFNLNDGKDSNIEFMSKLDKNNNFTFINGSIKSNNDLNGKLHLENKKLTGNFIYDYKEFAGYDYQKNKSIYKNINISILLDGKLDYKNIVQDLNIKLIGKDELQKEFLNMVLSKNNDNYEFNLVASNNDIKVIDSNIKLENKKIIGTTKVYDNSGKQQAIITNTGKYETDYLELNTKIELAVSPINIFTGQINNKNVKPVFNFNIKADTKNNKNNANIYIDYSETEDKILEIELDNKSTRSFKKVEIKAPTNTMELEEAMGIGY